MTKLGFKETEIGMIPEDWEVKELGEVCQLVKKQYNPSKKDVRAYIGLEHIEQQNLKLINIGSTEDIDSNKFEFKAGQILFGKLRPYFRKVYRPKFDGVCSTDIWVIDSKGQFDNGFIFYFLADQRIINEASNSSEGTRMPRARWDYLSRLEFAFPSIVEQRAIASILSSLDDKIALNHSMNSTLEAIGQAIFKHWFVDFEFPNEEGRPYKSSGGEMVDSELGEIPRGWKVIELEKFGKIVCGKTPPKSNKEYFGGEIPFIKIPDMHNQVFIITSEDSLTEEGRKYQENKTIPAKSICVSCIATVGLVSITSRESQTNQQINSIIPDKEFLAFYLFFTLKDMKKYLEDIGS